MKIVIRLFILLASHAGLIGLVRLSSDNRHLSDQIDQLEAELGRMSIDDADRVYLVEIDTPDVPPEVALHLESVWQFRCYLPPGYDYDVMRFSGGGRVAKEGSYLAGGTSSSWGSPQPEAIHKLLTVSFQRKDGRWAAFYSFGGTTLTTYAGGLFVLCPKSRESQFNQLLQVNTPTDFDPSWIATEAGNERIRTASIGHANILATESVDVNRVDRDWNGRRFGVSKEPFNVSTA
ncbi:MAG: hypothetical protein WD049_07675 [Candidatus Paceibacterota bacterium]